MEENGKGFTRNFYFFLTSSEKIIYTGIKVDDTITEFHFLTGSGYYMRSQLKIGLIEVFKFRKKLITREI
jgi:hypothetical protein